jgi:hypothetical protein
MGFSGYSEGESDEKSRKSEPKVKGFALGFAPLVANFARPGFGCFDSSAGKMGRLAQLVRVLP